jgi:hypothetical protein
MSEVWRMGKCLSSDGDGIIEYSLILGEWAIYIIEKGQEAIKVLSLDLKKMRLKNTPNEDGIEGNKDGIEGNISSILYKHYYVPK